MGNVIKDLKEQVFRIGGGGLTPLGGQELQVEKNASYHMGASSSPEMIIVTRVEPKFFWYKSYPYKKEMKIEKNIGLDLCQNGVRTWLKQGYAKYDPDRAKAYRRWLDGGKPHIVDPGDYDRVEVLISGKPGEVDVYGIGKQYGVAGAWDSENNTVEAEMSVLAMKDLKNKYPNLEVKILRKI